MEILAGQGTAAMEVLEQMAGKKLHAVVIPVGGGGFLAGMITVLKQCFPDVQVIVSVNSYMHIQETKTLKMLCCLLKQA